MTQDETRYWSVYLQERKTEQRNHLVWQYIDLVRQCVERVRGHIPWQTEEEDMFACGVIGLIEAVEGFNPRLSPHFPAYAYPKIRYQMRKGMEAGTGIPRRLYQKKRAYEKCRERLCQQLKREPTHEEIASEIGIGWRKYQILCQRLMLCRMELYGLRCPAEGAARKEQSEPWEDPRRQQDLQNMLKGLPSPYYETVVDYFYEEKSLRKISEARSKSRWKIKQDLEEALACLKNNLEERENYT